MNDVDLTDVQTRVWNWVANASAGALIGALILLVLVVLILRGRR